MIETICSNCGNIRIFEDSFAGKKFKCPSCGNVVEIKLLETETIVETDNVSNASVEDAVSKRRAISRRVWRHTTTNVTNNV